MLMTAEPPREETTREPTEELETAFSSSPFAAIRELEVEYHDGVITLRGSVPTFYTRQVAIALAKQASGVATINDRIRVPKKD